MAGLDEVPWQGGPGRRVKGRTVVARPAPPVDVGLGAAERSSTAVATPNCNEVRLVGRVSGEPEERLLPSGDSLVSWRVVVDRPPGARRAPAGVRAATVDTVDCVAWPAGLRRTARGLAEGDVVEVTGALRRRFWRAGPTSVSRTEVEVDRVRRLSRRRAPS